MTDFSTLKSLFQMMTPSDLFGVPQSTLGTPSEKTVTDVIKTLFDQQGGGAITAAEIRASLSNMLQNAPQDLKDQLHRTIRLYSSEGSLIEQGVNWYNRTPTQDQSQLEDIGDFKSIIGARSSLTDSGKKMSVIVSTSNFITPATRKAANAELFLNFVPSYVISRCVPYLNTEFVFDRPISVGNKLSAPGLMRFLLGAKPTTGADGFASDSADAMMVNGIRVIDGGNSRTEKTIMGMEAFTSPQTLVNPTIPAAGSRYVPVIDPFRPFMSIEGLTINITPTVGTFSYKKATLTLKLHDRSRLAEIADLIKPLVYTKTTVWLTYGWRHPNEPNNPYAAFINDNMLVREPYGIVNAGYTFDQVGQVTVTLELFTKGTRELRDIRITGLSESFEHIQQQIADIAEEIGTYRRRLNLDKPTGLSAEIRSFQVLEAGERGEFPDIKPIDVQAAISSLQRSLITEGSRIDSAAANGLVDSLKNLYAVNGKNKEQRFNFKDRIDRQVSAAVDDLFNELTMGPDPFLMTAARDEERIKQLGLSSSDVHPFVSVAEAYHKVRKNQGTDPTLKFKKRIVSLGKIFSVFLGRAVITIPGIDELQLFFYNFNERAGKAAGQNLAEFPIDMSVFYDQFKQHVNRHRSDKIALEEFLKLIIQAQLGDVRGVGYDFFSFFEPYDPNNTSAKLTKNKEQNFEDAYAGKTNGQGPFKMPTIEVYVESTYVTAAGNKTDLLSTFDQAALRDAGRHNDKYTKVMRVHVYDRQVNPYPLATSLLKRDDANESNAQQSRAELLSDQYADVITKGFNGLPKDIQDRLRTDKEHGVVIEDLVSNEKIKRFVSKLLPTIVFGGNASLIGTSNVTSKNDPLLTATQMMANKSGRPSVTQPNGGGTGGLPLRIIPASVTLTTMGCPLLDFMQLFFLDYNTGTTLDSVFGVTGLTHTIAPGRFESQLTMTFFDSYGQYESPSSLLQQIAKIQIPE